MLCRFFEVACLVSVCEIRDALHEARVLASRAESQS